MHIKNDINTDFHKDTNIVITYKNSMKIKSNGFVLIMRIMSLNDYHANRMSK